MSCPTIRFFRAQADGGNEEEEDAAVEVESDEVNETRHFMPHTNSS